MFGSVRKKGSIVLLLLISIIMSVPSQVCAADVEQFQRLQKQLVLKKIIKLADQGKLLSDSTFGIGCTKDEIEKAWGKSDPEEEGSYPNHASSFVYKEVPIYVIFSETMVDAVYPTSAECYPISEEEIKETLGAPADEVCSEEPDVKVLHYLTRTHGHHLLFIVRVGEVKECDYYIIGSEVNRCDIETAMEKATRFLGENKKEPSDESKGQKILFIRSHVTLGD